MAVKIRLTRTGSKKRPSYRIVVTDGRMPRDGRFIEIIGHYHPVEGGDLHLKEERGLYWLTQGACPTQKVRDLFKQTGLWKRFRERETTAKIRQKIE
ncbi:TPA: 30S ribosomal protein S16 [bacterium]|nr:30S ribosomal protein S16 [bacterium]